MDIAGTSLLFRLANIVVLDSSWSLDIEYSVMDGVFRLCK